MKIKLWSIQDECGWNELQSKGTLIANEDFVEADVKPAYDWMRLQMNIRIEYSSRENQYPIWAWYQAINEHKKRPDLRETSYLPKGTTGYRIELEKEAKDVLLSDFELWHTPLAYKTFIPYSEQEYLQFEQELIEKFGPRYSFLELPGNVRQKIEKSWEKIFDMKFHIEHFARPFKEKQIQATFWELHLQEIIKVDRFKAR